jgi:hypothetical protein
MKGQNDVMKKKVDECEFLIQKAQKKTTLTDDIAKQLATFVIYSFPFKNLYSVSISLFFIYRSTSLKIWKTSISRVLMSYWIK